MSKASRPKATGPSRAVYDSPIIKGKTPAQLAQTLQAILLAYPGFAPYNNCRGRHARLRGVATPREWLMLTVTASHFLTLIGSGSLWRMSKASRPKATGAVSCGLLTPRSPRDPRNVEAGAHRIRL